MEPLYYKAKELFPGISLDKESGKLEIYGVSCPFDAYEFYEPVFKWFDEYIADPSERTVLDLKMSYFNTVSAKFLLRIMIKLNRLSELGNDVKLRWFYDEDDEDMKEEGEEFSKILKINFKLIPVKNESKKTDGDVDMDDLMDDLI